MLLFACLLALTPTFNRHVWTYWDSGESNLPAFNQYNLQHWRKILKPKGYEITVLDQNSLIETLGDKSLLPSNWDNLDQVVQPYPSQPGWLVKMVPAIVRSDFARLAVLEKFGGVWMDTSNILLQDLDTIVINSLEQDSTKQVAGYVMQGYASAGSPMVNSEPVDGLENWFLAAKPDSRLISTWRKAFVYYWETKKSQSLIRQHSLYQTPGFDFGRLGANSAEYLNQHAALKYILFKNPSLANEILPVQDLKPWWLHGNLGDSPEALYLGFVSERVPEYRQAIIRDQVKMLKLGGPHLTHIHRNFKQVDDFCKKTNLLEALYGDCA